MAPKKNFEQKAFLGVYLEIIYTFKWDFVFNFHKAWLLRLPERTEAGDFCYVIHFSLPDSGDQ